MIKIAYITSDDPDSIRSWSGTSSYIAKSLEASGFNVIRVGPLKEGNFLLTRIKLAFYKIILGKKYLHNRDNLQIIPYSKQIAKKFKNIDFDLILTTSTLLVANLDCLNKPLILWCDATFSSIVDFYPEFTNLCHETIVSGDKIEEAALKKASLIIYSSAWAAESAVEDYHIDSNKVKVIPFGANIYCDRNYQTIKDIIYKKNKIKCKLLFIGVDWIRKGGDLALEIAVILNKIGLNTELHIVGCDPKLYNPPSFVKTYGFLSKNDKKSIEILNQLFETSHFLVVPSIAECFGIVFAEASSWGLPSIAMNVGGVSSVIKNDINGYAFDLLTPVNKYCDYIYNLFTNSSNYEKISLTTFDEYMLNLNWEISGTRISNLIDELIID